MGLLGGRARGLSGIFAVALPLAGCDVTSTVGYDESALSGPRCSADSTLTRCNTETCAVAELGPALVGSGAVAVDGENVFYQQSLTTLSKLPVRGGQPQDLVTDVSRLANVALDGAFVYWIETEHAIRRVPKGGGASEVLLDPEGHPTSLAVDHDYVYATLTVENQLVMVPKAGGKPRFLPAQASPVSIAADAMHVYWLNQGSAANSGELLRAPLGNLNGVETLLSNLDTPIALAVTPDAVFFAAGTSAFKVLKSGGAASEVLRDFDTPKALAAFEDTLYVAGGWGLARVNASGVTRILVPPHQALGVALGCEGVFATGWFEPRLVRYGR